MRGRRRASLSRSATDSAFERALSAEIAASELLRTRVVAATLAVLLAADQLLYLFARDLVEQFYQKPLPAWLPARIIGPFLAYEIVALLVLHYRLVGGNTVPTAARFVNALIETSLPTVGLWANKLATPAVAFSTWPTMLYFIYIVASTLQLDFVLPAQRLGRPASKGCVRIPAAMNRFLDRHSILDADYEQSRKTTPGSRPCCSQVGHRRRSPEMR